MKKSEYSSPQKQTIEIAPSYNLPLALIIIAIPLSLVKLWLGGVVALFGFFLLFQAGTIRLSFTEEALEVYRQEKIIRKFPYSEWQNWRIFWPPIPILFYFKEVKSIHFLPILFNPETLKNSLEQHCPRR